MDLWSRAALAAAIAAACSFAPSRADTTPLGPSFRVSADHLGTDTEADLWPVVAANQAGRFMATWLHETQALNGGPYTDTIYARLYGPGGSPLTPPFVVGNTPFRAIPSVAMDAAGNSVIAWNGPAGVPQFRRYDAAGVPQGAAVAVSQCRPNTSDRPVVAMDPAGDFVLGLTSYTATFIPGSNLGSESDGSYLYTSSIKALRFAAGGVPQGACIDVAGMAAVDQRLTSPSLAMTGGGDFVIAWNAWPNPVTGVAAPVYARYYHANALPEDLGVVTPFGILGAGGIAAAAAGDFRLAWSLENTTVQARFFTAAGIPQTPLSPLPTTVYTPPAGSAPAHGGTWTHIASSGVNQTAVTWLDSSVQNHTYITHLALRRYGPDGGAVGGQLQLDDDTSPYGVGGVASAAIDDAAAGLVTVWVDSAGNIRARQFSGP